MTQALLLIDIQRDYFPGGAYPLPGADAAADAAAQLLGRFRTAAKPVVHVQHISTAEAPFFRLDTPGIEHDPRVAPRDGEPVIVKHAPSAFLDTDLHERLGTLGSAYATVRPVAEL